ncbi:uncharacterized protein LOC132759553 [Ruditapes philippinarum]|uniref:uncharacterized protein LOC132759553 n=1 Tax=Ruditapes philippinarum TaxID=129788 RepID=UPI00295BAE19|nr:uncharacterized protein LOC132759553 [Ruditapes philippinarum]
MKYNLVAILLLWLVCNSAVLGCGRRRRGRRSPPPDRTRPTIKCPPNVEAVADPIQINTKVWWDERTISANDDRDGPIKPVRSGKAPGKLFSGTTNITYTAKDKAGNYASCSFNIIVKILVCSTWGEIHDGWKICHVSYQMRRGSVCRFGCYGGHELVGPSKTTCLDSEQWDTATQPFCQKLQCDELFPSTGQYGVVDISCTDNNFYRSKCSYNCKDGYNILPGHSKVRVCNEYGNWRGRMPICEDTSPPVFQDCPYVKVGYAEPSKTSGKVWWNEPRATDNIGIVNTIRISGPGSGTELEVGEHTVTYMASDAANNTAICEFNVVVKQIKCHMIYPLPYTAVVCPTGRIFGSSCEFTCDNGTALNGHPHAQCDKTGEIVPYGRWTFMNNQPYCENIETCPALRPPDNGALACDTWLQGKFCQILCEDGYVVKDDIAVQESLLVCGDSGTWYLSAKIPDCLEVDDERESDSFKLKFEYYYYEGPCDEAREDIKNKFIEAFNKSSGQDCKQKCSVRKVNIICGNRTGDSSRKRKSTDPTIMFTVTVELSKDLSPMEKAISRHSIKNSVTKASENGDFNLEIDGFSAESPTISVSYIEGECSTGSAYDRTTMQCVKCSVGYFHD